jgi:hypothetical protein
MKRGIWSKTLINYVWYLDVEITDNDVAIIHRMGRLHYTKEPKFEVQPGRYELLEGAARVVTKVELYLPTGERSMTLPVANRLFIFSYPGLEGDEA